MPHPAMSDAHKAELSHIINADVNAQGFIHSVQYKFGDSVLGQSRRRLIVDFTYYEPPELELPLEYKITISIRAETGVTAEQIKEVLSEGDCGDFDKLVAEDGLLKVKVKAIDGDTSEE